MHETREELYGVKLHLNKGDPEYNRDRDDPTSPYYMPHHSIIVDIVGNGEVHVTHDFPGFVIIEVHDYEQEAQTGLTTEFEPSVGRKAVRQARDAYGDFVMELDEDSEIYREEVRHRLL